MVAWSKLPPSVPVSLSFVCAVQRYALYIVSSDAFAKEKLDHMKILEGQAARCDPRLRHGIAILCSISFVCFSVSSLMSKLPTVLASVGISPCVSIQLGRSVQNIGKFPGNPRYRVPTLNRNLPALAHDI